MTAEQPHRDPEDVGRLAVDAYRRRLGHAPPAVADAALARFRAGTERAPTWSPARILLALAGVAGLALDVPVLVGASTHTTQDVAVLHVALAVGLLIAAWRPQRTAAGLAPVLAAASVLLYLPALGGPTSAPGAVDELSHLPIVVGAASLLLGGWVGGSGRRRGGRTHA